VLEHVELVAAALFGSGVVHVERAVTGHGREGDVVTDGEAENSKMMHDPVM
jgi:hypothetical protein